MELGEQAMGSARLGVGPEGQGHARVLVESGGDAPAHGSEQTGNLGPAAPADRGPEVYARHRRRPESGPSDELANGVRLGLVQGLFAADRAGQRLDAPVRDAAGPLEDAAPRGPVALHELALEVEGA